MNKYLSHFLLLIVIILSPQPILSANNKDSLLILIDNTSEISEKIKHYHTLSQNLSQLEDSYKYALKAYELSTEHNLIFDRIRSLWNLGNTKIHLHLSQPCFSF